MNCPYCGMCDFIDPYYEGPEVCKYCNNEPFNYETAESESDEDSEDEIL